MGIPTSRAPTVVSGRSAEHSREIRMSTIMAPPMAAINGTINGARLLGRRRARSVSQASWGPRAVEGHPLTDLAA
jgi:hypothetical protein